MHNRYREEEKEEQQLNPCPEEDNTSPAAPAETEILPAEDETEKLKEDLKQLTDRYLRVLAETENFKKRINEERIRERKYGAQRIFEKLVEVLDIFDQVLNINTDDDKLKKFLQGFEIVNEKLKGIAADEGVKRIECIDKDFNPSFHHAMGIGFNPEKGDNVILEVYQNGYLYKDRVLRPALVIVNKHNKEENKQ